MGGHRTELGLTVDSAGGRTWNGRWRESLGKRPKIDPKLTQIGPRRLPRGLSGAMLGQERPESAKNTQKSRESRAKVGTTGTEGAPRGPKKEPKIEGERKKEGSRFSRTQLLRSVSPKVAVFPDFGPSGPHFDDAGVILGSISGRFVVTFRRKNAKCEC